jgi:2',3'-cyclic-nucleotide 2'-phosphodiesterase (5'-nucleotidase family)
MTSKRNLWRTAAVLTAVGTLAVVWGAGVLAPRRSAAAMGTAGAVQTGAITTAGVKKAETEAGNLLADAVRAAASADIGVVPAAAFRSDASAPRPLTGEQAAGLVDPASDEIVVLSLRGDQIMAALERSVSFSPQPSSGFLQVSGLRFTYDAKKEGGKRVVSVTVAGGQPLDAARTYKVATTRPLANGQQGYFQIWDKGAITGSTGKSLAAALAEYGRANGNALSPSVDGRIGQTK